MHKIYENDDLMMYFKDRFCHCCGKALKIKKTERIVRKGTKEHRSYSNIGVAHHYFYGDLLVIGKEYYCASCNKTFTCDEQSIIIEAQKKYGRRIVSEEEITDTKNCIKAENFNAILKQRWLLLIPVIGGVLCGISMSNSLLDEEIEKKINMSKLTAFSAYLVLGIAIILKVALCIANNEMLNKYQIALVAIPSLLSFNIPTLWFINHTFKRKKDK